MDIGTAKPDAGDARARAASPDRHHRSDEAYSAARFRADALAAIAAIRARGARAAARRRHDALLQGAARGPVGAAARRSRACAPRLDARAAARRLAGAARRARARRSGDRRAPRAHRRAAHPARARGVRARRAGRCRRCRARATARRRSGRTIAIALVPGGPRARCTRAIARRFDAMLAAGLVDELRGAARAPRADAATCRRCAASATGRRGNSSTARIDAATLRAKGIAATRQLAKRQLTWLRAMPATAFDAVGAATSPTR